MARFYGSDTNPLFRPAVINILSITNSYPMVVTTTFDGVIPADNNYITGLIVRLIIPSDFGMELLNKRVGPITVINGSSFSMDIDTTQLDPFVVPTLNPGHNGTAAQVNPFAEQTAILDGSFINVYQQPPPK